MFDFTNTVDSRLGGWGPDLLERYEDLVAWGERAGLVDAKGAAELRRLAARDPSGAKDALARAKTLREAIYKIFAAVADNTDPAKNDVAVLETMALRAMAQRQLRWSRAGAAWTWLDEADLESLTSKVALAAVDLLVDDARRPRAKQCHGPNCGWLFLDNSRNGSRRWCSEESCGVRSRVKRFRARATSEE